jgi:hypothetical protein
MRYVLALVLLATACGKGNPPPAPAPVASATPEPTVAPVASVSAAPVVSVAASAPEPPPAAPKLDFVAHQNSCDVVDHATKKVVGHATNKETAAGGSDVTCLDFQAEGKVIRFQNSRGTYAKDARPGKTNDHRMPCGDGIYSNDASSCVELDTTVFAFSEADPKADAAPFEVLLCITAKEDKCTTLFKVPRGLNRISQTAGPKKRWWDAAYCENDRVVAAFQNEVRYYEAPSGKLIGKAAAPNQTSIKSCKDGTVQTNDKSFKVTRDSIAIGD